MNYIDNEIINQIRQNIDITEVINEYVPLTKKGLNYVASCPFHEDRNPSFSVSKSKQIFKCFSCGRGGNVFTFLQEIEGIDFVEAVKIAAKFTDIQLNDDLYSDSNKSHPHQDLLDIHQKIADFYHYYLVNTVNGQEAYKYLLDRGFDKDVIETFQVGLSPDNVDLLLQYLKQFDFSDQSLRESGIFLVDEDRQEIYADRFKQRIVFPLANTKGEVVAFSGRKYQSSTKSDAKYLNSPETPIFNKSNIIYNFHRAKANIRQKKQVLICEGYMDVMALTQFGIENVVATMGTSLTQHHLEILSKHSNQIYFIFDGDEAGQKATLRAFELSQSLSKEVIAQSVQIPKKADPDEWIKKHGVESFQKLLEQGIHYYDFYKAYLKNIYHIENQSELTQYIDEIITFIAKNSTPIEKEIRLQDIAHTYQIPIDILKEQVARRSAQERRQGHKTSLSKADRAYTQEVEIGSSSQRNGIQSLAAYQSEKQIIFHLIFYEEAWKFVENLSEPLLFFHDFSQRLYFILEKYYYEQGNPLPLTGITNDIHEPQMSQLISEILWDNEKFDYNEKVLEDCIKGLQLAFKDQEIKELRSKIQEAYKNQDQQAIKQLSHQIMQLMRHVKTLRR